jgi:outer membrane receptor protein involved in Fe transport
LAHKPIGPQAPMAWCFRWGARVNWCIDKKWLVSAGFDNLNNETYFAFSPNASGYVSPGAQGITMS